MCVFVDVENIVTTMVTLDNPSEDGTCHNFNSAMFEVLLFKKLTCMMLNCFRKLYETQLDLMYK